MLIPLLILRQLIHSKGIFFETFDEEQAAEECRHVLHILAGRLPIAVFTETTPIRRYCERHGIDRAVDDAPQTNERE